MADPDEVVQEYSSLREEECALFEEYREDLKEAGATYVVVRRRDGRPNRAELWGPTRDAVDAAAERYKELHAEHIQ